MRSVNDNGGPLDADTVRWKGMFLEPLWKLCQDLHPRLSIQQDALSYIEELIFQILNLLCSAQLYSVQDVELYVQKIFPQPINVWAITDAHETLLQPTKSKNRKNPHLPLNKIHQLLKEKLGHKIDWQVALFIAAVLEYIAADILKLTGNYVKNIKQTEITCQDLKVAMRADMVLMELFCHNKEDSSSFLIGDERASNRFCSLNYNEAVKELIHDEVQFVHDLELVIRVFRRALIEASPKSKELDAIFSNIMDIHEMSVRFLGSLEDTQEMCRDLLQPTIGSCFIEMAEGAEFDVFVKYTNDILHPSFMESFNSLLERPNVRDSLQVRGQGFFLAVKYVLPKLLLRPVLHCLQYFAHLELLLKLSQSDDDREELEQTQSSLVPLKIQIEAVCSSSLNKKVCMSFNISSISPGTHQSAVVKLSEIQKTVEGWDNSQTGYGCNEFIMEGPLSKVVQQTSHKLGTTILSGGTDTLRSKSGTVHRITDLYVFLFDSLILLCKPVVSRSLTSVPYEYKFKESHYLRRIDVKDHDSPDDLKFAFDLLTRTQQPSEFTLVAKSLEDKQRWMAALVLLQTKSMLERMLESSLADDERRNPLILPLPDQYRFAERDMEDNIIFEDDTFSSGMPLIKGATLLKLVERLTFHTYVDPKFLQTFLTTFRDFCAPSDLLSLLIERFEIPEPCTIVDGASSTSENGGPNSPRLDELEPPVRDRIKRFRKEYMQPVQFCVLNVIRQWVDRHWYDFAQDIDLTTRLRLFLTDIRQHSMRKWVDAIVKILDRKKDGLEDMPEITFIDPPPPVEWNQKVLSDEYDLMTLHPIEVARQITLLEFDLYRAVKPIELVGAAWTKKDKDERSPKLLKLIRHSTKFTYWLEKCIVETGNFEERIALTNRILEIMCVFHELNNFTGLIEIYSVLQSSPVHRLNCTLKKLDTKLMKAYERVKHICTDAHWQRYHELLRSINPPCVPFFGIYLSRIIFLEEGNPTVLKKPTAASFEAAADAETDFLSEDTDRHATGRAPLISFAKCRKMSDIIGEMQMYQNQPYCLHVEPNIRHFFETLNPLADYDDKHAFETYLYERSCEIEPKDCDRPTYFPPSREYPLRSPGIKPLKGGKQSKQHTTLPDPKSNNMEATMECLKSINEIKPGIAAQQQQVFDAPSMSSNMPPPRPPRQREMKSPPPLPPKSERRKPQLT